MIDAAFDGGRMIRTLEQERITACTAVPAIYYYILNHPDFAPAKVAGVRWASYGGAPIAPALVHQIGERFAGARLANGFGLTECTSIATLLPHEWAAEHADSVGFAAPHTEIAIDGEVFSDGSGHGGSGHDGSGHDGSGHGGSGHGGSGHGGAGHGGSGHGGSGHGGSGHGGSGHGGSGRDNSGRDSSGRDNSGRGGGSGSGLGEILIRGQSVCAGYWNKPDATARTFADGWLRSGDVGRVSADGLVYVLDRIKDMINRGGENIYCVEVENALIGAPGVGEVAVVGVPDAMMGEKVGAVIVPLPGASVDPGAVVEYARGHLADFKLPQYISVQTQPLPRNPNGKVLKAPLRATSFGPPLSG